MEIKIKGIPIQHMDQTKQIVLIKGIPFEKIFLPDPRIEVEGTWLELLPPVPVEALKIIPHSYEMIFNEEKEDFCVSFEVYGNKDDSFKKLFIRGVLSIKNEKGWWQHIIYRKKTGTYQVLIEIRSRQNTNNYAEFLQDPYKAAKESNRYGFQSKLIDLFKFIKFITKINGKELSSWV